MDLLIENGDYVLDGKGGLVSAEGSAALLQRILFRLTVPRGSFLPLPEFGSNLAYLTREKPSTWQALAGQYIQEALEGEDDVTFEAVELVAQEGGKVTLQVEMTYQGELLTFATTVI